MISREQQDHWQQARLRSGFDPTTDAFGRKGLFGRLEQPGIGVVVLPADTLGLAFDLEPEVARALPDGFSGLTANGVGRLDRHATTSQARIKYAALDENSPWRAYAAARVDGGVEVGIGGSARYGSEEFGGPGPHPLVYRLHVLVHCTRVAILSQTTLLELMTTTTGQALNGPYELIIALPDVGGAMLGGLNEGWERPEHLLPAPRALEHDALIRIQLDTWPSAEDDQRKLLYRAANRVREVFGRDDSPFLALSGAAAGRMTTSYA